MPTYFQTLFLYIRKKNKSKSEVQFFLKTFFLKLEIEVSLAVGLVWHVLDFTPFKKD